MNARKRNLKAGVQALKEEISSWMPKAKGWPKEGERVRLLHPHPCAGRLATVVRPIGKTDMPMIQFDNGDTAFITQRQEWEAA